MPKYRNTGLIYPEHYPNYRDYHESDEFQQNISLCLEYNYKNRGTSEKKRAEKKEIFRQLEPMMKEHGFVRLRERFMRIHGDHLLQLLIYDDFSGPSFLPAVTPLYSFWPNTRFLSVRNYMPMTSLQLWPITVENALGYSAYGTLAQGDSYLNYYPGGEELQDRITREKEFLENRMLPLFDKITTAADAICFHADYRFHSEHDPWDDWKGPTELLIRNGQFKEAYEQMIALWADDEQYKKEVDERHEFIESIDEDYPDEEKMPTSILFLRELGKTYLSQLEGKKTVCEAIKRDDRKKLFEMMDEQKHIIYDQLRKHCKKLMKLYPEQPLTYDFTYRESVI